MIDWRAYGCLTLCSVSAAIAMLREVRKAAALKFEEVFSASMVRYLQNAMISETPSASETDSPIRLSLETPQGQGATHGRDTDACVHSSFNDIAPRPTASG